MVKRRKLSRSRSCSDSETEPTKRNKQAANVGRNVRQSRLQPQSPLLTIAIGQRHLNRNRNMPAASKNTAEQSSSVSFAH